MKRYDMYFTCISPTKTRFSDVLKLIQLKPKPSQAYHYKICKSGWLYRGAKKGGVEKVGCELTSSELTPCGSRIPNGEEKPPN